MTSYAVPDLDPSNQGNRPGDGPLRPGGQTRSLPTTNKGDLPSTLSPAAEKQQPAVTLMRETWCGTETIRARGSTYLPKAPGEDSANYAVRLMRSVFFNVVARTIEGLVGQVFRRDPTLGDDVPPVLVEHAENIDLAGTHFDVFARDLLQDALTVGHVAVFVEFPKTGGTQSLALERTIPGQSAAIRPYWVPIRKENILSWRSTVEHGKTVLTQVVLRECTMVPDGAFGEVEQERFRVLYRENGVVGFRLLEITKNKSVIEVDAGTYPTQEEIPLAEIRTSGSTGIFESDPPLLDLAYLNIAHYQQWSDYATSIHKTCVPVFTMIGANTDESGGSVVIGPNSAISLPVNGDAKYVSHTGDALAACKAALDDLKSDMGTLGIAMLSPQKRTAETAAAKRMDKATEDSALAVTARGLQDGLERAFGFHARYLRLPSGGSVDINREFDEQTMQADMLSAWTQAVSQTGLPARLMTQAMQEGGLIAADEDLDALDAEMAANAEAAKVAEQQAVQDRASLTASAGKPSGDITVKNPDGSTKMTLSRSTT